jgi:hypothetical protein
MAISKRSAERALSGLKRLLPIIQQQKIRDVSEADTVTVVKDILAEVFGFDKYTDLSSEQAIRGTYCDLSVAIDEKHEKPIELIEIKSAGRDLEDRHVKQAIDYAANAGIEWVILTNCSIWRLYQVTFGKPINKRLLIEVDLTTLDLRNDASIECLAPFMKEGLTKKIPEELRDRQDATSKFLLSALILDNDNVMSTIRRELRHVVDVLVADEEIRKVLQNEVIKRELMDGPEADAAVRRIRRAESQASRGKSSCQSPAEAKTSQAADPSMISSRDDAQS